MSFCLLTNMRFLNNKVKYSDKNSMKKIILLLLVFSVNANAELKGVINLGVLDINNKVLANATGFIVTEGENKLVLTSFHLLNINIVLAEKIIDIKTGLRLEILSYDEDFDLLILDGQNYEDSFNLAKNCNENKYLVVGYYKNELRYLDTAKGRTVDTYEKGLKSIDSYLPVGFSGAPVLDSQASVCGLVVLSSQGNSNSIYLDSSIIIEKIAMLKGTNLGISDIRQDLGIEFEIKNNAQLADFLNSKNKFSQQILMLNPDNLKEEFTIKYAENLIIKSKKVISKINISKSANIYVSGILFREQVNIRDSHFITITSCKFSDIKSRINLNNSSNLVISHNQFKNVKSIFISKDSSNYELFENYASLKKEI